jgi:NAD+ kinase
MRSTLLLSLFLMTLLSMLTLTAPFTFPPNPTPTAAHAQRFFRSALHSSPITSSSSSSFEINYRDHSIHQEKVCQNKISYIGPSTGQAVLTHTKPKSTLNILVLVKQRDDKLLQEFIASGFINRLVTNTFQSNPIKNATAAATAAMPTFTPTLYFEPEVHQSLSSSPPSPHIKVFSNDTNYDLCLTLGGDGLVMHASTLFPRSTPPVLAVAGGSLGFLTPFKRNTMFDAVLWATGVRLLAHKEAASTAVVQSSSSSSSPPAHVFPKHVRLSMRMRLACRILSATNSTLFAATVLNELSVDRGSSSYLSTLDCFCDDVFLTNIAADGILVATPTGSTAYSMAAGGSVVHPAVPAILLTPICPHVLSFRPMVLPDHVTLRLELPSGARSEATVAFDGKHRHVLKRGEAVEITMSEFPMPTINFKDHSSDWLGALKQSFGYNARGAEQMPLGENFWR